MLLFVLHAAFAASIPDAKLFDIPAGEAVQTLKAAAQQGGLQIVFVAETVQGVRTNAVRGELRPREVLDRLVANTGLIVVQDEKTGTFSVHRAHPVKPAAPARSDPKPAETSSNPLMKTKKVLARLGAMFALAAADDSAADAAKPAEDMINLSPFEVKADPRDTYEATNTNSVTGTNTPLSNTPLDAKIFGRQMMDEMGVIDTTEMLSKLAGLGPAVISTTDVLEMDRQDPKSMTMRGLQINNPRRDGFLRSDTTLLDSFDIERVEAIGGSNSLLFGSGDAGGVVTSQSKRAYLNRRPTATVTATGDSEGTRRYTIDAQAGAKYFALRFNGVKSEVGNFRPGIRQQAEGYHITATVQPWRRLQIRGEYRYYNRDTIFPAYVTVRAPTNLRLNNGVLVDNQDTRYLVAFPETQQLLGGTFDLTKSGSAIGPLNRDDYFNHLKSIVAEAAITDNLALQIRYGHDARVNQALRPSSTTVYAPGAAGNSFADPVTGQIGTRWAMNQTMTATPFWTGARGYRVALAYQKDLGKWFGRHQASVFRQDMRSWTNQQPWKFYEADANGNIIQNPANLTNTDSGRTPMPATWMPIFPDTIIGGHDWKTDVINHPNGKIYKYAPQIYSGAVPKTASNPMGLSGPINSATGQSTITAFTMDDTRERSVGTALFSEWWRGHIDTMAGLRREEASGYRNHIGLTRGPLSYDSLTTGIVVDTPVKGLRVSANYATNAKINFDTTRDIFNNPLPVGKGVSRDLGLKFDLWDRRISGNVNYYVSEAKNFTTTLGGLQDEIDPAGINGRHGGGAYTYSKTSDGINVTLSARPLRGWEVRLNVATANGSERSDVILPQFYNDQFNTMSLDGQQVVAIKTNATAAATPLMVPSNPADSASAQVPLSLAMMKDRNSPYYAQLDPDSGRILNATSLGLLTTGVGTGATGLPITEHQLGFTSPTGGTIIVRKAGEKVAGFSERSFSLINRYQFGEGRLRGFVVGLSTSYQQKYRGTMYTDAADGNKRKMFYFPDRFLNDVFVVYRFNLGRRVRASVQANISNLFDENRVLYIVNTSTGAFRFAQWFNVPRKFALTSSLSY